MTAPDETRSGRTPDETTERERGPTPDRAPRERGPEPGRDDPERGEDEARPPAERPAPGIEHEPEPDAGNIIPAKDRPGTL